VFNLPWNDAPRWDSIPSDSEAEPSLEQVLTVRRERQAMVRDVMESLTGEQLASLVTRTKPGWPRVENFAVRECLRIVLNEEREQALRRTRSDRPGEKEN
jgi:hypothetical protein